MDSVRSTIDVPVAIGALGLLGSTVGLASVVGVFGVFVSIVVAAVWYWMPAGYAFAAGQIVIVSILSTGDAQSIYIVEGGFLALLAGDALRTERPVSALVVLVGTFLLLTAIGIGLYQSTGSIATGALVLVLAATLLAYALHRYQLVTLGLVADSS